MFLNQYILNDEIDISRLQRNNIRKKNKNLMGKRQTLFKIFK